MERLSLVIEKLQLFIIAACNKCDTVIPNAYASFLVYIQLSSQLKLLVPHERDNLYHDCGTSYLLNNANDHSEKGKYDINMNAIDELKKIRRVLDYAIWAYFVDDLVYLNQELNNVGYTVLDSFVPTKPGFVGYYLAVNHEQKSVLIGVRGTYSLEEVFTDMSGLPVSLLDDEADMSSVRIEVSTLSVEDDKGVVMVESDNENENSIRCHEGIYISTKRLLKQVEHHIEKLVVKSDYKLLITGHSLGASAACLLAILLRSKYYSLSKHNLEVIAFAPPPILDHDTAIASIPYITSIVNNGDIIARISLSNLSVLLEFLKVVSNKLTEKGLAPNAGLVNARNYLQMLAQGDKGCPLFSIEEVRYHMKEAYDKVELRHPDHLYVPGRVLLLHQDWEQQRQGVESDITENVFCTVTDGAAKILRFVDVDGLRMLSDHSTDAYAHALDALCN